jgi:glycosyltransferase A (GT-A) superfamily protein (DUF2064 family)
LGVIHAFKCQYKKQLISKTAATMDGELLQDAAQMKMDVSSVVHVIAEPWILITSTIIKNCFVKCGFSTSHVGSSVMKITEDKENDSHSLQPLEA